MPKYFQVDVSKQKQKQFTVEVICFLLAFLFLYAAVSKVIDPGKFETQMKQSFLIRRFADILAWVIPGFEVIISVMLFLPRFRMTGIYLSFYLLISFTIYISFILTAAHNVPCACGGILDKMNWSQHLIFNLCFLGLAPFCIALMKSENHSLKERQERKRFVFRLSSIILGAALTIGIFYAFAEAQHSDVGQFKRKFEHVLNGDQKVIDLKYNSYYFVGTSRSTIYLANVSTPFKILGIDRRTFKVKEIQISISTADSLITTAAQVRIDSPYFYIADGSKPGIYEGRTSDWTVTGLTRTKAYFNLFLPLRPRRYAVRSSTPTLLNGVLGLIETDPLKLHLDSTIIGQRIGSIFSNDGWLLYNKEFKRIIYTSFYKNSFLTTDTALHVIYRSHTLDTFSTPRVESSHIESNDTDVVTFKKMVNNRSSTYGSNIFINSAILATNEIDSDGRNLDIDVFDLFTGRYKYSFALPKPSEGNIKDFQIDVDNTVLLLYDRFLSLHEAKLPE